MKKKPKKRGKRESHEALSKRIATIMRKYTRHKNICEMSEKAPISIQINDEMSCDEQCDRRQIVQDQITFPQTYEPVLHPLFMTYYPIAHDNLFQYNCCRCQEQVSAFQKVVYHLNFFSVVCENC